MKFDLRTLHMFARTMTYSDFEDVIKHTIAKRPMTERIDKELTCEITLET